MICSIAKMHISETLWPLFDEDRFASVHDCFKLGPWIIVNTSKILVFPSEVGISVHDWHIFLLFRELTLWRFFIVVLFRNFMDFLLK